MTNPMQDKKRPFKDHKPEHFLFETEPTAASRRSRSTGPTRRTR